MRLCGTETQREVLLEPCSRVRAGPSAADLLSSQFRASLTLALCSPPWFCVAAAQPPFPLAQDGSIASGARLVLGADLPPQGASCPPRPATFVRGRRV